MTKMRIAFALSNLRPLHSVGRITFFHNAVFGNRLRETGPACAAVELIERAEKRLARDDIDIDSGLVIIPVGILKRSFGAAFSRHAILIFGKLGPELGLGGNCFGGIHLLAFFFLFLSVAEQDRTDNYSDRAAQTDPYCLMRPMFVCYSCAVHL